MPIHVYQFLHYAGILLVFTSLGAVALHVLSGGTKDSNPMRKLVAITHGVGLVLVLVAGFGMLARLGIHSMPGWVIAKLVIWLFLGGAIALLYHTSHHTIP